MATKLSARDIVKHIINGTLESTLCCACLKPLGEVCENIFTQFWFENKICTVAGILKDLCQAEFTEIDNYNICSNCIVEAFTAYNFYLKFKNTRKFLEDYVNEIEECSTNVDKIRVNSDTQICLQLSVLQHNVPQFDVEGIIGKSFEMCPEELDMQIRKEKPKSRINKTRLKIETEFSDSDNRESLLVEKKRKKRYIKRNSKKKEINLKKGERRCDVCNHEFKTFNFLIAHQKIFHELNYCEICSDFYKCTELESHMEMHGEVFCCDICQMISDSKEEIEKHIKKHNRRSMCHKCGFTARTSNTLQRHMFKEHGGNGATCPFCGKKYAGPIPLQRHMSIHKIIQKRKNISIRQAMKEMDEGSTNKPSRAICSECGADYVNGRALNMHVMRVHTGERPFTCEDCGRGFVSKFLRDQHIRRVHRLPEYRCPLCPYAFHTIGYVSIHVKKVHLRKDKRCTRGFNQEVTWPTKTVPFEKLRIDVQHGIVDMVRAGELSVPQEMLTDNLLAFLEKED